MKQRLPILSDPNRGAKRVKSEGLEFFIDRPNAGQSGVDFFLTLSLSALRIRSTLLVGLKDRPQNGFGNGHTYSS
jgi:hypothetical protein